jgi:hypothetical protein
MKINTVLFSLFAVLFGDVASGFSEQAQTDSTQSKRPKFSQARCLPSSYSRRPKRRPRYLSAPVRIVLVRRRASRRTTLR